VFVPRVSGCRACFTTRRAAASGYDDDFDLVDRVQRRPPSPATLVSVDQSQLTMSVPCACTVNVRVRWSEFLHASDKTTKARAHVTNDGSGWTNVIAPAPGTYVLSGSLSGGLLR